MGELIYHNGKIVGEVKDNIFYTQRNKEHFMRMYQGFGISIDVLIKLQERGVTIIRLTYYGKNGEKEFFFSLKDYLDSDLEYKYGDDLQKFLKIPKEKNKTIEVQGKLL